MNVNMLPSPQTQSLTSQIVSGGQANSSEDKGPGLVCVANLYGSCFGVNFRM